MPYNTRNPIGSTDPRDLSDNAVNLDTAVNNKSQNNWIDRCGAQRLTWQGIEQRAKLDTNAAVSEATAEAIRARNDAIAAASASGNFIFAKNIADMNSKLPKPDGTIFEVAIDSNYGGTRTRYEVVAGTPKFLINMNFGIATTFTIVDYGAATTNTSASNTAAFVEAEKAAGNAPIYVPKGVWKLTTPYALGVKSRYFGPGVLQFDVAEHKRRGGSSGSVSTPENYTLMYRYAAQSDVSVLFDGVAQVITWVNDTTVQAPGSTASVQVNIQIVNGVLPLGPEPISILTGNTFNSGGDLVEPVAPPDAGWHGTDNISSGARSQMNLRSGVNNTSYGSKAQMSLRDGSNNTSGGFQSLYRLQDGNDNTTWGSVAGEWLIGGDSNTLIGGAAGGHLTIGSYNTDVGHFAGHDNTTGYENTNVGYRSGANTGSNPGGPNYSQSTNLGAFAGAFSSGSWNSYTGFRAGSGPNSGSTGSYNVANGYFAARNITTAQYLVAIGAGAAANITVGNNVVAIGGEAAENIAGGQDILAAGFRALETGIANRSVALGTYALQSGAKTAMDGATATGFQAGQMATGNWLALYGYRSGKALTTGDNNCAFGPDTMVNTTTGRLNSAFGAGALSLKIDGTPFNLTGCTGLGQGSRASGDNQVQLGTSGTTTYAYGAVQDRCDIRDKAGLVPMADVMEEFFYSLEACQGYLDMRDDYVLELFPQQPIPEITVPEKPVVPDVTTARNIAIEFFGNNAISEYLIAVKAADIIETAEKNLAAWDAEIKPKIDAHDLAVIEWELSERKRQLDIQLWWSDPIKDGSKKRKRLHNWFQAQQVKEAADRLGIDFAGHQDHRVNGGADVQTLGDAEFMPIAQFVIKKQRDRILNLERILEDVISRLERLERLDK